MFILKKILISFFLPPGIFIVLLVISGIYFFLKRQWKICIINLLTGISLLAFSMAPVSDAMLMWLEYSFIIPKNQVGDVIILMGGGVYDKAPDMSGNGSPSEDMLGRVITAVRLQKKLGVPVIVSGGAAFKERAAEAPIVKRFLTDLGVPPDKVILEDKSRDTIENARFTQSICKKNGYKKPILVTSAYHMKRAVMSFKKIKMDVLPFPAHYRTWKDRIYIWEDYLPGELENAATAIHEYLGLLFYMIAY